VPFSTRSSSFLGSDQCHAVPTVVALSIIAASRVYLQKRISFKEDFELTGPFEYQLKQELSLELLP
jgi:hypothetical protein